MINRVVDISTTIDRKVRGVPSDREVGRRFGLEWAEAFHHIGPRPNVLDQYIARNAVPL